MLSSMALSDHQRKADSLAPLLVSVASAQALLGIGHSKVWQLIGNGALETVHIGTRRLVTIASINRFIERLKSEAASRKPTAWAQRCGKLASAANKGRPPGSARRKAGNGAA
jgi:hypothetical protein